MSLCTILDFPVSSKALYRAAFFFRNSSLALRSCTALRCPSCITPKSVGIFRGSSGQSLLVESELEYSLHCSVELILQDGNNVVWPNIGPILNSKVPWVSGSIAWRRALMPVGSHGPMFRLLGDLVCPTNLGGEVGRRIDGPVNISFCM